VEQAQRYSQIHGAQCWPAVDKVSPCEEACPIHTDVPSYVMAIAQGKFREALDVIREVNPFPSVCGRVCHHPCEEVCNRGRVDRPIAIQWLKRKVADMGLEDTPTPVERRRQERVAIVGSGPAGLTAAYDLVRTGYGVTVYESLPVPGGMLTVGIPEFILPRNVALSEIDYIRKLGVNIRSKMTLGQDFTLDDLWSTGYKAILLALGCQKGVALSIPGANLEGVQLALPLLRKVRLGEPVSLEGRVVIVGGGNVAMDAARTALRLGAGEVHLACLEALKDIPAFPWEVEATTREKVRFHNSLAPQEFKSKDGRRISGIDFKRVASTLVDDKGRISWTLQQGPGSDFSMEADEVIIAIGQSPEIPQGDGLKLTEQALVAVDPDKLATSIPGVFAAGDIVQGAGTVIEAIAEGHRAAAVIDSYLSGTEAPAKNARREVVELDPKLAPRFFQKRERWSMPALPTQDAVRCFDEVYLGYTDWAAVQEARRCLNCRSCVNCVFERGQLCLETARRLISRRREV